MNDMEITNDWIDRYNENELNEEEKAFFIKRMELNPLLRTEVLIDECLNRLYQDEGTMDLMKKIHMAQQKPDRRDGRFSYLLIAASLLYLIVLGVILKMVVIDQEDIVAKGQSHRDEPGNSPAAKIVSEVFQKNPAAVKNLRPQTWNENSHNLYLAMNYIPLPDYELLVGSVTRSARIELRSPIAILNIQQGIPVKFKWVYQDKKVPVNIVVYDNRGRRVFETLILLDDSYKLVTKYWPGGIYYWKIITDEEMICMGKIILF